MKQIIECVPNISEGNDIEKIKAISSVVENVEGIKLLNVDPGKATNRTVITFVGEPQQVIDAAFLLIKKAQELIDMSKHSGEHPRMGATDVCPLVPIANISMKETVKWAHKLGEKVGNDLNIHIIVLILFIVCVFILLFGGFGFLDSLIKFVSIILLISTFSAFIIVIINGSQPHIANFTPPNIFNRKSLLFIIALIGWMPTAVDMSVWNSIWTVERINHSGYKPKLNETLLEFNIGYVVTIILSVCFITLGAFVMYGTGELFPNSSSEFAKKLIYLYTHALGKWSYWIIAIASFSVMFSTTLAVFDGYARTIRDSFSLLFEIKSINKIYSFILLLLGFLGYLIVWKFIDSFKQLIDLATTISFLIAPFCAILNYKIIFSSDIPPEKKPPYWIKLLSLLGIVFLLVFSLIFILFL